MKSIPLFVVLFGVTFCKPNLFHTFPSYYEHLTAPHTNVLHSIKSQFHTQDELGQYMYGYNDGLSSKIESKTADGITQGSYAYVDSNGIVQNVNYISDDLNGFRVSTSNLPVAQAYQFPVQQDVVIAHQSPTQIVGVTSSELTKPIDDGNVVTEAAKISQNNSAAHNGGANKAPIGKQNTTDRLDEAAAVVKAAAAAAAAAATATRTTMLSPSASVAIPAANIIPTAYTYQPYAQYSFYPQSYAAVPITSYRYHDIGAYSPVYSQFHTQDELGQYSYGYSGGPSSKVEVKTADGVTRGGYSYIDANGILQKVNYIADPVSGFRVSGTNLPVSNMATSYFSNE